MDEIKAPTNEEGDKKTLDLVSKTKKNLSKYRKQFEKNWKEEEDAYHGKIWKHQDGYRPYENHVFQIIEGEVPILTDSYPGTTVKVTDPQLKEQAKNLDKAVKWVQQDQDLQLMLPMVIRNSLMSAPGFIHPYHDANAENGQGQIKHEIVHWENVWLHGGSLFIEDAPAARIELSRTRSWMLLNYPNFEKKIKDAKSESLETQGDNEGREDQDTGNQYAKRSRPKPYIDEDTLKLVKTFIKDYSIEPIPEDETAQEIQSEAQALQSGEGMDVAKWQDHAKHLEGHGQLLAELYAQLQLTPDMGVEAAMEAAEMIAQESPESGVEGIILQIKILESHMQEHEILQKENKQNGRLKYPNALRCIETLNDIILYDGPSRDEHNEIPLVPFYCYRDGTIYGHGEIRHILDSQRMHAVMQYKEYKGLQRVANPSIKVYMESGLTKDEVTNEDGGVYEIPEGSRGFDHVDPGSISPQIGQFNGERKQAMTDISGINEVTQGKTPSPNASGVTVKRTQQQAIGRIRLKDRQNQKYSIKRLGKLDAALIIQYWTDEKILELEDGDGEQIIYNPLEIQDLEYEIEIAEGSMAGIDKESYNALLSQFLAAGHMTFPEFLEVAEIPRKEKIIEMVSKRSDIEGQLQQTQQELIKLKGNVNPQLLSPEEMAMFEEMQRQELLEQQQGAANGQPESLGAI